MGYLTGKNKCIVIQVMQYHVPGGLEGAYDFKWVHWKSMAAAG
jgi:hypothetical protein